MLDATRTCEMLIGLPDANVLEVIEPLAGRIEITVESRVIPPSYAADRLIPILGKNAVMGGVALA